MDAGDGFDADRRHLDRRACRRRFRAHTQRDSGRGIPRCYAYTTSGRSASTMRQSTASPGLLSLIQGRTVLTRILMRPGGCATQGILFQPNGQPLPPEEGGECTISQGASSGNQPLLFLTHTGTVVGEPQGTWITIKCCSVTTCEAEHYKGCHCCAQY